MSASPAREGRSASEVRVVLLSGFAGGKASRSAMALLFLAVAAAVPASTAEAAPIYYTAVLDGPSEAPPNASPGTGFAEVWFDADLHTMRVVASFSGLIGTVTASHIHAPTAVAGTGTASVATQTPSFTGFPSGVTSGTYDHTFDMSLLSSYRAGYVTDNGGTAAGAEAALFAALQADKAYFNIHTTAFPGGEIRGFLEETPAPVPEPASLLLLGTGLAGLGARRWRHRR